MIILTVENRYNFVCNLSLSLIVVYSILLYCRTEDTEGTS